jgi:adenylyltransferase/sulfurtransferase
VALTNRQIDRYSRQLIVDKFGGLAQERLLASRVLLLANSPDLETVLSYLVGAGVGRIDLHAGPQDAALNSILARMHDLNSDCIVALRSDLADLATADEMPGEGHSHQRTAQKADSRTLGGVDPHPDLALVIVGDSGSLDRARALFDRSHEVARYSATVFARLDLPSRIAALPRHPPCPRCANVGELLASVCARAENTGFVAMLAALEAVKLLSGIEPTAKPLLIEFNGYESCARVLDSAASASCGCAALDAPQES